MASTFYYKDYVKTQKFAMEVTTWPTGFSDGVMYITGTIPTQASSTCIERRDITATITGGNYLMGSYNVYTTGASFGTTGFIMGHYSKIDVAHLLQESYAVRGRVTITGAQAGDTSNQHIGVFGGVELSAVAIASAATGGYYGVCGYAQNVAGCTADQPMIGGYFTVDDKANIAGDSCAIKGRVSGYGNYGCRIDIYTSNSEAAYFVYTSDAAKLPSGIKFEASATGGASKINHAFEFVAADESDGASVVASTVDNLNADGVIKIDCAGTDYYIPFWDAGAISTEWADVNS